MSIKFIDLFCGLGGIRIALENACKKEFIKSNCILSSEIKKSAIKTYELNFNEKIIGDIKSIEIKNIKDFDILLGGFPCQAFSNAGKRLGFEDTRGTLFFEIAKILKIKSPQAFILENVEGLISHDKGNTFKLIINVLKDLGYNVDWKLLNAKDYGLAQNRNRVYIVGAKFDISGIFDIEKMYPGKKFEDIRQYNLKIKNSNFNKLLNNNYKDLSVLAGKAIKDKRGGSENIHSWDLGIRGIVSNTQKELLQALITKRRYKKWAIENKTEWFDGIPLNINQIKTFINYKELEIDLDFLEKMGYLKKDYPKDFKIINGVKTKISREDLPIGYTLTGGKLSFEFNYILNDKECTPTIVATDSSKIGVIENSGIRKLSEIELKRLFGFSDSYQTAHLKESELFDLFGNSVAINVIEKIATNLIKKIKYEV